jgi:4-azaleucine resistance transporter AzlC
MLVADALSLIMTRPYTTLRSVLVMALPAAAAIGIFGTLYGAAARPFLGVPLTLLSSIIVFSGSLQFAMVAVLAAGAGTIPVLLAACVLNLRHLVLGAVMRPRIEAGLLRRALLAFFLVDETFGFAVAAGDAQPREDRAAVTERTMLATGLVCYVAWIVGTVIGLLGGGLPGVERVAGAVFPVLFIGLAAMATGTRSQLVRAVTAAALTIAIGLAWPDGRMIAPVIAGVLVALPAGDS